MEFLSQYKTLDEYWLLARRMIMKRCYSYRNDDDAISYVAHHAMLADSRYKEGIGTRDGFRVYYATMACYKWLNYVKIKRNKRIGTELFDMASNHNSHNDIIAYRDMVDYIKTSTDITDLQRNAAVKYYVEGWTMQDIADEAGVSRQNVDSHIKSVVKKVKEKFKDN